MIRRAVRAKKETLRSANRPKTVEAPHKAAAAMASNAASPSIPAPGAATPKLTTYAPHSASDRQIQKRRPSRSFRSSQASNAANTGCVFCSSAAVVGLPILIASVKQIVPSAEPPQPIPSRAPHCLRLSDSHWERVDHKGNASATVRIKCSMRTICALVNVVVSGRRKTVSVPHRLAPRATHKSARRSEGWFDIKPVWHSSARWCLSRRF